MNMPKSVLIEWIKNCHKAAGRGDQHDEDDNDDGDDDNYGDEDECPYCGVNCVCHQ